MNHEKILRAKYIFERYNGSHYQMERAGIYQEYKSLMIPKAVEKQWIREKLEETFKKLLGSKSGKEIAESFALYGHYVTQINDTSALMSMLEFVMERKDILDANTLFRCINSILSTSSIIKEPHKQAGVIRPCIDLLNELFDRKIRVSDDYKENGKMPDFLSEEKLRANIYGTMQYWSTILAQLHL